MPFIMNIRVSSREQAPSQAIALTKKYVRENGKPSANYYAVETSAQASELLNALKAEFSIL